MSFHSQYEVENGDQIVFLKRYSCDKCSLIIDESWPRHQNGDFHLCTHCAFKEGEFSEKEYLESHGLGLNVQVGLDENGEITLWGGKNPTPPWKRKNKDSRNSAAYIYWRNSVFKRDDYTCQHCLERGGDLNAHHIKPFARYKKDRYKIENGITLCVDCHREEHRKK